MRSLLFLLVERISRKGKTQLESNPFLNTTSMSISVSLLIDQSRVLHIRWNACGYLRNIKREISCWFKEFAWLFLGSQGCKYDNKTYDNGTLLNITSKRECNLHKCIRRNFRKVSKEIIQYCEETCEMGWLPGCCLCKRKSESLHSQFY